MDLKNPKVTIFNYKLNKLSIYLPFALFIPFLLRNIWANREQLSYLKIISINNTENILNITPVWKLIGTTTNLFLPILAIFVFELLVLYKTNKFNLNYTSLGKLKNSEKYKYVEYPRK